MKAVLFNGIVCTEKDAEEIVRLAEEFAAIKNCPEADLFFEIVRKNAECFFGRSFPEK